MTSWGHFQPEFLCDPLILRYSQHITKAALYFHHVFQYHNSSFDCVFIYVLVKPKTIFSYLTSLPLWVCEIARDGEDVSEDEHRVDSNCCSWDRHKQWEPDARGLLRKAWAGMTGNTYCVESNRKHRKLGWRRGNHRGFPRKIDTSMITPSWRTKESKAIMEQIKCYTNSGTWGHLKERGSKERILFVNPIKMEINHLVMTKCL